MLRVYKKSINFINLILVFLIGILIYLSEIYVLIIYPPEFLDFVSILRVYLIIILFQNLITNFIALYAATYHEKRMVIVRLISFVITTILITVAYLLWGFTGFLAALVLGKGLNCVLFWVDGKYLLKEFDLPLGLLFKHLLIGSVIIFVNYWLFQALLQIVNFESLIDWILNLLRFTGLDLEDQIMIIITNGIQAITFVLLFIFYLILFKGFTKKDLKTLENGNIKIPFKKLLYRLLR